MTPKEKAEELLGKYYLQVQTLAQQKQCALIAVDEILDFMYEFNLEKNMSIRYKWWQEVKQEIEKL